MPEEARTGGRVRCDPWLVWRDDKIHRCAAEPHVHGGEPERRRALDVIAKGATRFVIGSARKHPHDLVPGSYSVHTTQEAPRRGEAEILRIGNELRRNGTLKR